MQTALDDEVTEWLGRLSCSSLIQVLREDYIRTARAKGLSERRVLYRHALRAGVTPLISQFGVGLAAVLGGVIVVEVVFGIDGHQPRERT